MTRIRVGPIQQRALAYVATQQRTDGGFTGESSPQPSPWQPDYSYQTTFLPALMLTSLSHVPGATDICNKLATFLQKQRSEDWSFNYWSKSAPERKTMPYPDDLDDTFCALIGLYSHDPQIITPAVLATMVKLLLATETNVGGPYRTWLVGQKENPRWQDVDLAVNANVAYFVSLVSGPLPNLQKLFASAITTHQYNSPYYPSVYPVWYYLARSVTGPERTTLAQHISQHANENELQTPMDVALLANSLLQLQPDHKQIPHLIRSLRTTQLPDGSWSAAAFCIDPARYKQQHFHGSPVLTTAFVLEALARYEQSLPKPTKPRQHPKRERQLQQRIIQLAHQQIQRLGPNSKKPTLRMLQALVASDITHEITLLPYYFAQSLAQPDPSPPDEQFFVWLGLANVYGWMAYSIYDDFLDDEGRPNQLSTANFALRQSLVSFQTALPSDVFYDKVIQTFNTIDEANSWEVTYCRFTVKSGVITICELPAYGRRQKLAERSLGHCLTPLAVLLAHGYSLRDPAVMAFEQAFQQYLIARQLNDDAHDWKEDIERGHITYVAATLLKDTGLTTGQHKLAKILPQLEAQFWHTTLPSICETMQQHVTKGQKLLRQSGLVSEDSILAKLFTGLERSIAETLQKQADSLEFLHNYSGQKTKS